MAQNHESWEAIFNKLSVVAKVNQAGFFDITADQIKNIGAREPRLMAKIDFREHLPPVMKDEGLAILAINNGTYRIGRFNPFIDIAPTPQAKPINIPFPPGFITLKPQKLAHESAALDAAHLSGMLEHVFGEKVALTIRGRSRSPDFSFKLGGVTFPITGVQIEVDGGYEGAKTINLVEAKIGSRNNLNVRQLIYPQLAWEKAVGSQKSVKTFICFYQEPILRFIPVVYQGGVCIADHSGERAFILEPEAEINLEAIPANPSTHKHLLDVPFPQADRFETVLAMFNIVAQEGEITKESLLQNFDIVPRQIDYYGNAMRWIGLVDVSDGTLKLTDVGRTMAALPHAEKIKKMAEIIFSEPIFNCALKGGSSSVPATLFSRWGCESESTRKRRLQTVEAWIGYFKAFLKST